MSGVTRVEVIGPEGRMFSQYFDEPMEVRAALQDSGETVKIFVDKASDVG